MQETKERIATAQWVLERQLSWIAAAEIKVGVVVTLDIAMLGGLATAFNSVASKTCWIYLFSGSAGVLSAIALLCAACSVLPRLDGPRKSLLFFGRIREMPRADYIDLFAKTPDSDILADWTEQIHRNSEIAFIKHMWVRKAMIWSFLSIAPWLIAVSLMAI
jgi:hypothetical protein